MAFVVFAELSLGRLQLEGTRAPGEKSWETCRPAPVGRSQSGDQHQPTLSDKNINDGVGDRSSERPVSPKEPVWRLLKNQCKPLLESNNHNKQIKPEIKPLQQTFRTQIFFSVDFLLFESLESLGFFFPVVSGTFCPLQKGCSSKTSQTNSSTLRGEKQAPRSKALTLGPTERL